MSDLGNKEIMSTNLRKYIELSGKDRKDIAKELEVSYSTLTDWINGNTYPRIDKIELMARYFKIMKSDLVEKHNAYTETKSIPLIGTIAAGLPILAQENIEDYFNLDSKIKADFALRIKGDSMINAGIQEQDIVFIKKQDWLENGEIRAILIEGEATLKKFHKDNGTIVLQAENKAYAPMIYTNGDLKILGKLVAVLSLRE